MAEIFASNSFYSRSSKKSSTNESFKASVVSKRSCKSRKTKQPVLQASLRTGKENLNSDHHLKTKKSKNRKEKYKNKQMKKVLKNIKPQEISEKIKNDDLITNINLKTDFQKKFFKRQNGERKNFTIEHFQPSKTAKMNSEENKAASDLTRYKLMSNCLNDSYEDDVQMDGSSSESEEDEEEEEENELNFDAEIFNEKDDNEELRLFSEDEEEEEEDVLKNINNIWNNEDSLTSPIKNPLKHTHQKSNTPKKTPITPQKLLNTSLKQTLISPESMIKQNTKNKCPKENIISPPRLHQMTLDFGQKLRDPSTCSECGLTYNANEASDTSFHLKYHNKHINCFNYIVKQKDNVVGRYGDGVVILVDAVKVEKLLDEVCKKMHHAQTTASPNDKVFIFVKEKKLVGLCVTERIMKAYENTKESACNTHGANEVNSNNGAMRVEENSLVSHVGDALGDDVMESDAKNCDSVTVKVGVKLLWVEEKNRRNKIASRLLLAVRGFFCLGVPLQPHDIAFLRPTPSCIQLATHFGGRVLVY